MKNYILIMMVASLLSIMGCGGSGANEEQPDASTVPCEESTSLSGKIGEVDLSEIDLSYSSALYNESDEEFLLDEMYDYLGLDKNNDDDVRLMQYIFGAANYRLIIGSDTGVRESAVGDAATQFKEELNIFIYDLEGYAVGEWVQIEDISIVETLFKYSSYEHAYATLVEIFREFRDDGRPNAIAGFNSDRTQDDLLLQDLVNVFSPRTVQAKGGYIALTSVVESGVRRNAGELSQPYVDIDMVSGEFLIDFHWYVAEGNYCLPAQIN